jgi:hypothetical protein
VSNLRKPPVPSISRWILNDSTGAMDVMKLLNLSRLDVEKTFPSFVAIV